MEALDYYGQTAPNEFCGQIAFGNLYTSAFGGTVYCYNDSTGQLNGHTVTANQATALLQDLTHHTATIQHSSKQLAATA